jgi:hypothetical protein
MINLVNTVKQGTEACAKCRITVYKIYKTCDLHDNQE